MFLTIWNNVWYGIVEGWNGIDIRRDELTGIAIRRYILTKAERHLEIARRRKEPIVFIVIDLDGLKTINDSKGHAYGDKFLKQMTNWLQGGVKNYMQSLHRELRKTDLLGLIGRTGGDELLMILPDTNAYEAQTLLLRLSRLGKVRRFSYGISEQSPEGPARTVGSMIKEADCNMYQHKQTKPVALATA